MLGLEPTPYFPKVKNVTERTQSDVDGTTNVLKRNWMDVFIRSVRNGKLLRLNRERIATELLGDVR